MEIKRAYVLLNHELLCLWRGAVEVKHPFQSLAGR